MKKANSLNDGPMEKNEKDDEYAPTPSSESNGWLILFVSIVAIILVVGVFWGIENLELKDDINSTCEVCAPENNCTGEVQERTNQMNEAFMKDTETRKVYLRDYFGNIQELGENLTKQIVDEEPTEEQIAIAYLLQGEVNCLERVWAGMGYDRE